MKKFTSLFAIASLLFLVSDCASLSKAYHHDYDNPCSPGEYKNMVECEKWQQAHPREFERYKKRMGIGQVKKDSIN